MIWRIFFGLLIILDILSLTSLIFVVLQIHYWQFVMIHGLLLLWKDLYFFGDFMTGIELFFAIYLLLAPMGFISNLLNFLGILFFAYKIVISIW